MTNKTIKNTSRESTAKKSAAKPRLSSKEKAMAKTITKLEQKIEELELAQDEQAERVQAAEEKMLRVVAEYENGKKRVEREKERSLNFAKDRVLMGLFPIIDNLERSALFENEDSGVDEKKYGIKLVLEQINKYLKETNNVESYDPLGDVFDPELHEAMAMQSAEGKEPGVVIDVFERGYKAGDRILRAAKVVVSQ